MSDPIDIANKLADALDAWDGKLMMPEGWRTEAADTLRTQAAEITRLRADLAKCGGDNCMGRRVDRVTQWVTVQARDAAVRAALAQPAAPTANLGPLLFQFDSFAGWVNHAQRAWKRIGVRSDDTVCIDIKGRICLIGRHFMAARDQGTFPVRVYMLRADLPCPDAAAPQAPQPGGQGA